MAAYLKVKSITRKLQRTASRIDFIKKSLTHNLVPIFAKVQGQFVNRKDKTRAKESILKKNLVEHKRNIQTLSRNDENLVEAKSQRPNLEQLKRNNNKLRILSLKVVKNRDSYQVPAINLSPQVLNTKPLNYFYIKISLLKINSSREMLLLNSKH